jgi:hypothetical protein
MASKAPRVTVRVTLARKVRIRAAAKSARIPMNEWVGRAIARELARERKVAPPSASDSPASDSHAVKGRS